jgi:hypothetical protein
MRFSWSAIAIAPLAVPVLAGLILAASPGGSLVSNFLFFFVLTAVLSYGASLLVLLPCLYLVSRFKALNVWLTAAMGAALGLLVYVPAGWISYQSTGPNSGPPTESFLSYLSRNGAVEAALFLGGGLITALAFWFLARPRPAEVPVR